MHWNQIHCHYILLSIYISMSFFLLSPFVFAGFDLVQCEDPGIPNYGYKIRDEGHFIDTVILYSCNPGYTMHGSSIMTCLSGDRRVWDKPLPTCIGNTDCDCSGMIGLVFQEKKTQIFSFYTS